MEKKKHTYYLRLRETGCTKENEVTPASMEFEFSNHDDIFRILQIIREKNLFDDEQQSVAFVLGLKLLGEVMLANKENELFSGFQPAFVDLMKKLKGQK